MQKALFVTWFVTPLHTPRLWLKCSRCNIRRRFVCSENFRINAQKKRLDAWLIYRCESCAQTWNYPIIERRTPSEIDPLVLQAMTRNAPALVWQHAFDFAGLGRHGEIEETLAVAVEPKIAGGPEAAPEAVVVAIRLRHPCRLRLDRLIAVATGWSRSQVRQLHDAGSLTVRPATRTPLRQDAREGQELIVTLRGVRQPEALLRALLGQAG